MFLKSCLERHQEMATLTYSCNQAIEVFLLQIYCMPTIWLEHHMISKEKSHYDHTDSFISRNDCPKSSMALRLLVYWRKEHCTSIEGTRPSYEQQGDTAVVTSPCTMPLESFHGEWHAQMATLTFTYLCNQALHVFPTPDLQWLNCDKNISESRF